MPKMGFNLIALLIVQSSLWAGEPAASRPVDAWDAAYLEGVRIGFFHTRTQEIKQNDHVFFHTSLEMDLKIKRYGAIARLHMVNGTDELEDGKVVGVFMTQDQEGDKKLILRGKVEGDQLEVTVQGSQRLERKIPWDDSVLGLRQQDLFYQKNKVKAGDKLSYLSYEPTLNSLISVKVEVKEEEEVKVAGKKQILLRVDAKPDEIKLAGGQIIQLPVLVSWLNSEKMPVRSRMEMPGMGTIYLERTDKAHAEAPVALAKLPDVGLSTLVPLNKPIPDPQNTKKIVFRVTLEGDSRPETSFAQDDRQKISNVKGATFDLQIQAKKEPVKINSALESKDEYRKSCFFLDSDNERVKRQATTAIKGARDDWDKARQIEKWVFDKLDNDNSIPFCPASQVAESMKGDCRQHSMLAAAMCRAVGIPSRTAVGLVYVNDRKQGPVLGFHMWAEVWVNNQWVSIDPTFGPDQVGAAHLKFADASWHDTQDLKPLIPVARVLGKLRIEVVEVEY